MNNKKEEEVKYDIDWKALALGIRLSKFYESLVTSAWQYVLFGFLADDIDL